MEEGCEDWWTPPVVGSQVNRTIPCARDGALSLMENRGLSREAGYFWLLWKVHTMRFPVSVAGSEWDGKATLVIIFFLCSSWQ